ncbi:hypothetical protein [Hymenobacter sp. B81]|uniref:hypothetical protein n=1 Tax=Hymenobacter sp. B81 TaxID=3344878 RepID=UPI0037DDD9E8
MPARPLFVFAAAALILLGASALLAYATPRAATAQLLALLALATGAYVVLLRAIDRHQLPLRAGLLLALALRLLWLPAHPTLSDDVYRFRWDGQLVAAGLSPYQHRPDEYQAAGGQQPGPPTLTPALYARLNSPHYYSVYPPLSQLAFAAAAGLSPHSERGFVLTLRLPLLLAEAATAALLLALLRRWRLPPARALGYLLHPMVAAELVGNLHFEALALAGLLLTLWLLTCSRWLAAGAALGLAVAAKLLPLLLAPLLLRRLAPGALLHLAAATALVLALLFAPFFTPELLRHLGRSLDLYFHAFEFNASVYYGLRALGYAFSGYNQIALIGSGLAVTAAAGLLLLAGLERRPTLTTLPRALLLALTGYYLLATTVHPWYLTPLVALGCFTGWRYPAAWAALAALSYSAYHTPAYSENPLLLGLEYAGLLLFMVLDWRRARLAPGPLPGRAAEAPASA